LKRKENRSWRQKIDKSIQDWNRILEAHAGVDAHPLNPALVYHELNKRLPDRAIFSADSGSTAIWYARYLKFRAGMMGSLSGNLASMGPAVPYAVAAKFAYPGRPVFALAGDGAMQMNGLNELITVSKYWKQWKDPRFWCLVLNNRDLNMVTWEMRAQSGEPKFRASQEIPDFNYVEYAQLLGLRAVKIERPAEVGELLDLALSADRPCLIEAVVDPEFPMMPPHVTLKEATAYVKAVLKGDPNAGEMIKDTLKTAVATVLKPKEDKGGG
jgi:pyruvate dehydrogenase (quinone)